MANYFDRYLENVPGTYFVDSDCIACDTCTAIAPNHFKLTMTNEHAFVYFQPKTKKEISFCEEALDTCPVNAIGTQN